jgi:putative flippase GtrA
VLDLVRRLTRSRLVRYIIAGSLNTGLSQLVYLAFLALGLAPGWAYAGSFAVGIAIGYVLHGRYVFAARPTRAHVISYPVACLARLGVSEWMLHVLLDAGVSAGWAGLIVNVTMVPVGFVLTWLAFTIV